MEILKVFQPDLTKRNERKELRRKETDESIFVKLKEIIKGHS